MKLNMDSITYNGNGGIEFLEKCLKLTLPKFGILVGWWRSTVMVLCAVARWMLSDVVANGSQAPRVFRQIGLIRSQGSVSGHYLQPAQK